jgi:hypothetical protein
MRHLWLQYSVVQEPIFFEPSDGGMGFSAGSFIGARASATQLIFDNLPSTRYDR